MHQSPMGDLQRPQLTGLIQWPTTNRLVERPTTTPRSHPFPVIGWAGRAMHDSILAVIFNEPVVHSIAGVSTKNYYYYY